jgi:hypothetical protein
MWIEKRHVGHKTPQAAPIIPHEVLTSETHRCTNGLQ